MDEQTQTDPNSANNSQPTPGQPAAGPVFTPQTPPTPAPEAPAPAAPVAQPAPPVAAPSQQAAPTKPVDKQRILLVEDDDSLAQVYQTRLDAEGFTVQRVPNGEDALVSALNFKPDLILLDVMMPKVSGFDVLDILRNTPETAKVKVIMLTALGQDSDKERAASLGVDEYLVKSQVVIADVVDRIKQHLGLS